MRKQKKAETFTDSADSRNCVKVNVPWKNLLDCYAGPWLRGPREHGMAWAGMKMFNVPHHSNTSGRRDGATPTLGDSLLSISAGPS